MSVLIFFIILFILVLSHEFGHFIVAKSCGMRVDEFGFGFPPRLFGIKRGGTLYSINLIPFGGFVKILGEDPLEGSIDGKPPTDSFAGKPRYMQALVISAGVAFNFLLAWLLISLGLMVGLPTPSSATAEGAQVENARLLITNVRPQSPADRAGLKPGDEIIYLTGNGTTVDYPTPAAVQEYVAKSGTQQISLGYRRGDDVTKTVVLRPEKAPDGGKPVIGIAMDSIGIVRLPLFAALARGLDTTLALAYGTTLALADFLRGLFTGSGTAEGVTGPVGIVGLVGDARGLGLSYLLGLTAVISVNLAVINMVPFPALDGGRMLFIIIESIRRKSLSPKIANALNAAGFVALIGLMIFLTVGDIARLTN